MKNIEKPPVLGDEKIKQANGRVLSRHGISSEPITIEDAIRMGDKLRLKIIKEQGIERLETQRDADAAYFEPLIQQAKAEVAREIDKWIDGVDIDKETHSYTSEQEKQGWFDCIVHIMQHIESKYLKEEHEREVSTTAH